MPAGPLRPNDILALWTWIVLMLLAAAMSYGNARKNSGRRLAQVWASMTVLCLYWFGCAFAGLFGAPFVVLYRWGIALAILLVGYHFVKGNFRAD